jgi:phosphomannomutase
MNYFQRAQSWLLQDPDPVTKAELQALIAASDEAGLKARFESRLEFGTAGLRGELGAGPNRMNQVVVGQTALAIAEFLLANRSSYLDPKGELSVVIGYDGRVNSDVFAKLSAEVFAGKGLTALLFDQMVATPVAAFTGRARRSSATIVVTASHNPPRDNGYKVYLGGQNGNSQLVPPQDSEIANQIVKIAAAVEFQDLPRSSGYQLIGEADIAAYVDRALSLIPQDSEAQNRRRDLRITHTSMHGVGWKFVREIFQRSGFSVSSVASQQEPDGSFPTVAFPNPEEPGAMDEAFKDAIANQSHLILANDPDADRLAVGYGVNPVMLTGDQVGLILAERMAASGAKVIANSIVSQDLGALAKHYGIDFQQTLTGFKWISKVPGLNYGYEEALGYCVDPDYTPDKDGLTAALLIAELASELRAQGQDVDAELRRIEKLHGEVATGQVSIRVNDLSVITKVMDALRKSPPTEIIGQPVFLKDFSQNSGHDKTDALVFTGENLKVIFRPSGTEPKLKCYLQSRGDGSEAGLESLRIWAKNLIETLS